MRIFIQNPGSDGDVKDQVVIDLTKFQKMNIFLNLKCLNIIEMQLLALK